MPRDIVTDYRYHAENDPERQLPPQPPPPPPPTSLPNPGQNLPGRARPTNPWTSHKAARLITPRTGTQRWAALRALESAYPDGWTHDEVVDIVHQTHPQWSESGIRTRVKELTEPEYEGGPVWVIESDRVRPKHWDAKGQHHDESKVWVLSEIGWNTLRSLTT